MICIKNWLRLSVVFFLILGIASCTKKDDDDNNNGDNSTIVFNPSLTYGTTADMEGNTYKTIVIGGKTWMAENLRVTKYNDGTPIARILVDSALYNTTTGGYDNYNSTENADTIRDMGRLYNWYAAGSGKLAPAGWHVATEAEWDALISGLGGVSVAGGKLKEMGLTHWATPNQGATNESGFTGMPAGRFYITGTNFTNYSFSSWFWSSTSYSAGEGVYYTLAYTDDDAGKFHGQKKNGYSVRCVKD